MTGWLRSAVIDGPEGLYERSVDETSELVGAPSAELDRIAAGEHHDPHSVLGAHPAARRRRAGRGGDPGLAPGRGRHGDRPRRRKRRADRDAAATPGRHLRRGGGRHPDPRLPAGGHLSGRQRGDGRRSVPLLADDGRVGSAPAGRGPARGPVAAPRRARPRASGGQRHVVRGLGAERAIGAGGRRLQQLGRPHEPDADAGRIGCLGDLPARRGRRRALQVRGAHPAGPSRPPRRPVRLRHRGAAVHGQRGVRRVVHLARRRLAGRPGGRRRDDLADVGLRGAPRLLAAGRGRRRRPALDDLPGAGRRSCRPTSAISASPTWSCCRSPSTRSAARGATR